MISLFTTKSIISYHCNKQIYVKTYCLTFKLLKSNFIEPKPILIYRKLTRAKQIQYITSPLLNFTREDFFLFTLYKRICIKKLKKEFTFKIRKIFFLDLYFENINIFRNTITLFSLRHFEKYPAGV